MRVKRGGTSSFLRAVTVLLALSVSPLLASAEAPPLVGVSPGISSGKQALTTDTDTRCPTFSWASPVAEGSVHLAVFELSAPAIAGANQSGVSTAPALEEILPAGAISWTPPFDRCLQRGWQYAWSVRFVSNGPAGEWSEPMFFRVASIPSMAEVRAALKILESSKLMGYPDTGAAVSSSGQPAGVDPAKERTLTGPLTALAPAPDNTGVSAEPGETVGVVVGALGISDSTGTGSAGLVGESDASTGDVIGIWGVSASAGGAAGVFENTAGGTILAGYSNGTQVFNVDGDGTFTAVKFHGSGVGITDLGDIDCPAIFPTTFGCINGATDIDGQAIGSDDLADGSVRSTEIKQGAVQASEIPAGAVTAEKIASGAVGASEIASNAINSSEIDLFAVSTRAIANGAVGNSELAANSIAITKLYGFSDGLYEASAGCANSGDLTLDFNCPAIDCGLGLYLDCSGTCNQASQQTCSSTRVGKMLDPAMPY